jgi:hypothetical protein
MDRPLTLVEFVHVLSFFDHLDLDLRQHPLLSRKM